MRSPTLLYLHGFRSSPQSAKARTTAERVSQINALRTAAGQPAVRWLCPQLPPAPDRAIALCRDLLGDTAAPDLCVIGSSLGGFYATYLAETLGCHAVLLNPAVDPARDLRAQIGRQTSWHDPALAFDFTERDVAALHALEIGDLRQPVPHPERFHAIIAQGDEVLDWREMTARFAGADLRVLPGGDHALSDYAQQHCDAVLQWCGVATPAA